MYLNVYIPKLQSAPGVVHFFRLHRGEPVASSTLMDPISKRFIAALGAYAAAHGARSIAKEAALQFLVEFSLPA